MVEHLLCTQGVSGSNPLISTSAFLDSSAVEHSAVNRRVVGSNPTRGAIYGVMAESVEGARLLIEYTFKRRIEGSNPSHSAIIDLVRANRW